MTRPQLLPVAAGASLAWLLTTLWKLPVVWFLPIDGRLKWGSSVEGVGIDLFGRTLYLIGGGLLGLALSRVDLLRRSEAARSRAARFTVLLFVLSTAAELMGHFG